MDLTPRRGTPGRQVGRVRLPARRADGKDERTQMLTILNYHRLVENDPVSFYDLSFDTFANQMRRLAAVGNTAEDIYLDTDDLGKMCVTFDDGTEGHYKAASLLESIGMRGIFFIVTGNLGREGYLSASQVSEMARAGHIIGSHTVTHRQLPKLSIEEVRSELVASRQILADLVERDVLWLAPPGGAYNAEVLSLAAESGYDVVRSMDWGYATWPPEGHVPCLPVLPRYGPAGFDGLISGRAPLWRYHVKRMIKASLGESRYVRLRDRLSAPRPNRN